MNTEHSPHRRHFIKNLSLGTALSGLAISIIGALRFLVPRLTRDSFVFKIGRPATFPVNQFTLIKDADIFIHRDYQGIRAVSAVCTHLGCILEPSDDGFVCPCHGSCYDFDGKVVSGPAPTPLVWYPIEVATDGRLVVNKRHRVSSNDKFLIT